MSKRPDTPLADSPEAIEPVTDLKSALKDIEKRSLERQNAIASNQAKLKESRLERSRQRRSIAGEGGRLYGLASFASTTGK